MNTIRLSGYKASPASLRFGTVDSYGVEQMQFVLGDDWKDLAITATFTNPQEKSTTVHVPADTLLINVPPEATAGESGAGQIAVVGYTDGVQVISTKIVYTLQETAPIEGSTPAEPTPSLLQQVLTATGNAETSAAAAKDAAEQAKSSASAAAASAAAATSAVKPFANMAVNAATDAASSKQSAADAAKAAQTAQSAAEKAAEDASAAKNAAETAKAGAEAAQTAAGKQATAAAASATAAENSNTAAKASADAAAASSKSASDTAGSIKDSLDQIAENKAAVSQLKEDLGNINKVVYNDTLFEDIAKSQRYVAKTGKGTLNGNHYVSNANLSSMVCQIKGFLSGHKYKLVFKGVQDNYYTVRTINTYIGVYVNTFTKNQYVAKDTPFVIDIDSVEWGDYIYLDFSIGPAAPSELYVYVYDVTNLPLYAVESANFESCLDEITINALNVSYDNAKQIVNYNNWYKNKKLTTLGDSITEQNLWQSFLKQELLFDSISNIGIGGTRISGANENAMWQDKRINAIKADTDVLTIMGGTNDSAASVNIGDISITNHDTGTFVGAFNVLISKVLYKFYDLSSGKYTDIDYSGITKTTNFKDICIYIITSPFNANTQYSGENSVRLKNIVDATINVAKMWGIPCIDVFNNAGINTENVATLLQDGVHPNINGAKKIASVVINGMKYNMPII